MNFPDVFVSPPTYHIFQTFTGAPNFIASKSWRNKKKSEKISSRKTFVTNKSGGVFPSSAEGLHQEGIQTDSICDN
jgi:hypothetical protein